MLCRRRDAHAFTIPGGTDGVLYPPHPYGEQSVAVVSLNGAYPEKGYSLNDRCTETMYVIEGSCVLTCDGVTHQLASGDLFMVLPGTSYRMEGEAKIVVCISPIWDSTQNHIVEVGSHSNPEE